MGRLRGNSRVLRRPCAILGPLWKPRRGVLGRCADRASSFECRRRRLIIATEITATHSIIITTAIISAVIITIDIKDIIVATAITTTIVTIIIWSLYGSLLEMH